eukprot:10616659-Alexandrium_andersonii.AAC.1
MAKLRDALSECKGAAFEADSTVIADLKIYQQFLLEMLNRSDGDGDPEKIQSAAGVGRSLLTAFSSTFADLEGNLKQFATFAAAGDLAHAVNAYRAVGGDDEARAAAGDAASAITAL